MSDSSANGLASTFRRKVSEMKSWKPRNPPSNRDRLELYALHKQAASGDAPSEAVAASSDGDMAKYNAWRSKRGMTQEEAIRSYITECDRQMRVYGTAAVSSTQTPTTTPSEAQPADLQQPQQHNQEASAAASRGLAAVPLLCAAASETRPAYLSRLRTTSPTDGWWSKQEPLCSEPSSLWATPESILLYLSSQIERFSLFVGGSDLKNYSLPLKPSVLQSFFWPLHNALLAVWVAVIIICTVVGSLAILSQTLLYGSNTTHVPLERTLEDVVTPTGKVCNELCSPHQALSIRLVGLMLWPLVLICNITDSFEESVGTVVAAMLHLALMAISWWYWVMVLPWLTFLGLCLSFTLGFGFFVIELAGMQNI